MNSSSNSNISSKTILLLAIFAFVSLSAYLLAAAGFHKLGFPLDDAWIHLTYARNLAEFGEWSFLPGQNSAGSTSPLWTFLLAIGFFLPGSPYLWTYFLGGLMLFLLAWRVEATLRQMQTGYHPVVPWAGLVIIFEWRLAWAAASGMEILLHAFLVLLVLSMLVLNSSRFLLMGVLAGISVWSRPDGITLLGPLFLFALLLPETRREKLAAFGRVLLGFAGFFAPYLLFNLITAGTPWPNTFYAKQAEYAFWQSAPVSAKLVELLQRYFVGSTLVLLPGVLLLIFKAIQKRGWGILLAFTWLTGYAWLYVSRMPLYQYGRYIMPTLAVFVLFGLVAVLFWLPTVRTRWQRRLRFTWLALIGMFSMGFWIYGGAVYVRDVAWIETEMVQTAQWASQNLPVDALVAAHDIGALGYYNNQLHLIDLAGLISPDVVPFIRDEARLAQYLEAKGASHLIAFPGWYPLLVSNCQPLYESSGSLAGLSGLGRMTVYDCGKP